MTPPDPQGKPPHRIEAVMSNLLRLGVLLSAAVVLVGGLFYLVHHGSELADHRQFTGAMDGYHSLVAIVSAALALDSRGIIQLGVLLLIATPVARVLYSLFSFVRERDRKFVIITLIVAAILLYGFLGGKA